MSRFTDSVFSRVATPGDESPGGLAEAVALVQASAVENASAEDAVAIVQLPEVGGDYLIVQSDGNYDRVSPEPGPPSGYLYSVDQVARAVVVFDACLVSVTDERVFVHTDREHLSRGVELLLPVSPEWSHLVSLSVSTARTFSQAELIRFLRVSLMGTLDSEGERLIEWARSISTTERTESSSSLRSHQESLGRSVVSEVEGTAGDIPERFSALVPIWSDRALSTTAAVPVLVDYSPRNESFVLSPDRREMESRFELALQAVEDRLRREVGETVEAFNNENVDSGFPSREVPAVIGAALG